jgi:hypothetical protein
MVWTRKTAIGAALLFVLSAITGAWDWIVAWFLARSFARAIWHVAGVMEGNGFDDPVYKKNLQRLIERNREFEKARNEPHS